MRKTAERDLIVAIWEDFGRPAVGASVLQRIQKALDTPATAGGTGVGPAAIARVLADAGASLLHPEIIEFDAQWREALIARQHQEFKRLEKFSPAAPLNLQQAESLIAELETLRQEFVTRERPDAVRQLREFAVEARRTAQSAQKKEDSQTARAEQREIATWLKIWLQTPALFQDWLELRKRSDEFKRRFGFTTRRLE